MPRRKTKTDESIVSNGMTYQFYLDRLIELSISMFDWKNVPDSIDVRFLETRLFMNGAAVFFKDEDLDYDTGLSSTRTEGGTFLALPVAMNGKWNVYNVPIQRRAYANSGYQKELDVNNSVIIYNNMIRTNSVRTCTLYAKRLWNLDRIIDVNANAQKTPVLILCDEQQRLTALNTYQQWDGNEPVIFATKDLDIKDLQSLRTDAPYVADKIYQLKAQIWNEALTYLGISNVSFQKKERMISDEVARAQGGVVASRFSRLEARREAVKQINEMFGLDIEVDYRDDYSGEDEGPDLPEDPEDPEELRDST